MIAAQGKEKYRSRRARAAAAPPSGRARHQREIGLDGTAGSDEPALVVAAATGASATRQHVPNFLMVAAMHVLVMFKARGPAATADQQRLLLYEVKKQPGRGGATAATAGRRREVKRVQ